MNRHLGQRLGAVRRIAAAAGLSVGMAATGLAINVHAAAAVSSADLSITNTESNLDTVPASPGDTLHYTVVVTNNSSTAATNVVMTDHVQPSDAVNMTTTTPAGWSCPTQTTTTVQCTIATLAGNATATFTVTANVAAQTETSVETAASVQSDTADPDTSNNGAQVDTPVVPTDSADLAVTKTGPGTVAPGGTLSYAVTVTNNGPSTANGVSLTDSAPAGTTFLSESQNSGPTFTCNGPPVTSCTLAALPDGGSASFTFSYTVASNPNPCTPISNTASVGETTPDPDSSNNSATATTNLRCADLAMTKTGPTSVAPGGTATYTLTITNNGPAAAPTALVDQTPNGMSDVSITQVSGPTFSCVDNGNNFECGVTTLANGSSAVFHTTFALPVNATASSVSNTAFVASTIYDNATANNSQTITTPVVPSADVAVTKTGPSTVAVGHNATYHVTVTNNGPSKATNVQLQDLVPTGTTFVSETQGTGPAFTCNGPPVTGCSIATLAPNASQTFTFVYHVPNGLSASSISNTATVSAATADPNSANNSATVTTDVTSSGKSADLQVTKSGPSSAAAGTNVKYTITVGNAGPGQASNVTLTDTVPTGTKFVSESQGSGPTFTCTTPPAGAIKGQVVCTLGTMGSGAVAVFHITVHIPANTTATSVENTAQVSSDTPDTNPANNSATVSTNVT